MCLECLEAQIQLYAAKLQVYFQPHRLHVLGELDHVWECLIRDQNPRR